jgi:hypothetical protein
MIYLPVQEIHTKVGYRREIEMLNVVLHLAMSRREDPLPPLLSHKKGRLKAATTMFMLGNTIPAYDIL